MAPTLAYDLYQIVAHTPPGSVIYFIIVAGFLYFVISALVSWHRLSHIPGPFLNAVSYWPMFKIRWSGQIPAMVTYAGLSQTYGPLVRIGPRDLITSDAELVRRMSAVRSTYGRSNWYKATRLDPYHDMMGSVLDKAAHHELRVKLRAGYLGTDIADIESGLDSGIAALIGLIRSKYLSPSGEKLATGPIPVDFGRLADHYAMDARSQMSFGEPIGLMRDDEDVYGLVKTANMAIDIVQLVTDVPTLQPIATSAFVMNLVGPKPTDKAGFGKMMGIAREHVATRFGPDAKDKRDLIGSFLRRGLDRRSAEAEAMFPMIAGSDTAAKAVKNVVQGVVSSSHTYRNLVEEIDAAVLSGRVSEPIKDHEARNLPYLQAVILEGLRIRPPFPGLIMKETGPEGDVYKGRFIPPGTRIAHDTWSLTHDAAVYGADADIYRPERWIEATEDERGVMKRQAELVFGSGRWQCAGKTVAALELNKIFVELFRNFDFELVGPNLSVVIKDRRTQPGSAMTS